MVGLAKARPNHIITHLTYVTGPVKINHMSTKIFSLISLVLNVVSHFCNLQKKANYKFCNSTENLVMLVYIVFKL